MSNIFKLKFWHIFFIFCIGSTILGVLAIEEDTQQHGESISYVAPCPCEYELCSSVQASWTFVSVFIALTFFYWSRGVWGFAKRYERRTPRGITLRVATGILVGGGLYFGAAATLIGTKCLIAFAAAAFSI